MVLKEIANTNYKNDNVPSILKPYLVSRKFVVERDGTSTYLQFGSGKSGASNVVADPQSVAINTFGKAYITDTPPLIRQGYQKTKAWVLYRRIQR